jgi:hypothetical protein
VEVLADGERTWIYRNTPFTQAGEWDTTEKGELMYRFDNEWYYSLNSLVQGFGKTSGGGDSNRLLINVGESRMSIAKIKRDYKEWKATNRAPEFIRERTISRALTNANRTLIERVDVLEVCCETYRKENRQLREENRQLLEDNQRLFEENQRVHEKNDKILEDNQRLFEDNRRVHEKNERILEESQRVHKENVKMLQKLDEMEVMLLSLMVGSTTVNKA